MDRKIGRKRAAMVVLAALVTALGSPAHGLAVEDGGRPDRHAVDAAVAFRTKLGLPAGRAFVESTFGNRAFASARWGVPLDAAEAAEVGRRAAVQQAVGKAVRAWAVEDGSAGAYIDQSAGGAPVFLTTGDPARARRGLARLLPDGPQGAGIRFARARHSTAELLALQARVNGDLAARALAGLGVVSTAIDTRANAVQVGVAAATEAVRVALAARYGPAVSVVAEGPAQGGDAGETCISRKDCPPAKGGIEIKSEYSGNNCTTGFLVRIVGSGEPRLLTAGHCISRNGGTGTSKTWTQAGEDVGWSEHTTWYDGADADAGLLDPVAGAVDGDRNLLYRASKTDVAPITGWAANAQQLQGGLVCRGGVTSGYHCGTIAATNRTKAVDGRTIDHQWVVDFDACPGDSGGPYVLGDLAYGIHTDSSWGCDPSRNQAWYSPIGWVLDVLAKRGHPVELCTTAACGRETNVWTPGGDLREAVWQPKLVALDDGRLLQVGGFAGDPVGPAAAWSGSLAPQLYDPATGTWSDAPAPPWAPAECEGQFGVRLADGRALVGGGRPIGAGRADACDGAWLFDPVAESESAWTSVAAPPFATWSAEAVILEDGRAFVAGGALADGTLAPPLAYSPSTDEWTTLPAAPGGGVAPLVLRLPDGRVLVSGGRMSPAEPGSDGGFSDVPDTLLYDPGANAWTTTASVGAADAAGAVLADGRVVVAGGRRLSSDAAQQGTLLADSWLFAPSSGAWSKLTPMRTPRAAFTLVQLPGGPLLVAGGLVPDTEGAGVSSRTAEAYDWTRRAWSIAPGLTTQRAGQGGATLADGRVLVAGGGTASTETYVPGDVAPPTATTGPSIALRSGARMSSSAVPIHLSWSATDAGGSGVGTFDIGRSIDGGPFTTIATRVPTPAWDTTVPAGHNYRFQVRPRDWAGNAGSWKAGPTLRVTVTQDSSRAVKYGWTWKRATVGSFDGGSMRWSKVAGASATVSFSGRGFSWVATRGPNRGAARIYVDGSLAATVNLYASAVSYRNVVFQRTWGSTGTHRIRIVVVGTRGHPVVDVDAFAILSVP